MTARTTMTELIATLRGLTNAGTADYTIGTVNFWSDDELQRVLDRHRRDFFHEDVVPAEEYSGSTAIYKTYYSARKNVETTDGGTAVFYLEDGTGTKAGTANYTADYANGVFTFTADQKGTAYYATGREYDVNGAAADIWRMKAAQAAAGAFNWSSDNHSIHRKDVIDNYRSLAEYYDGMAWPVIVQIRRGDQ